LLFPALVEEQVRLLPVVVVLGALSKAFLI
jgi:hypothetical protein